MSFSLLGAVLISGPVMAEAPCFTRYDESKYFYKIDTCNDQGIKLTTREFFAESGKLSNETFFDPSGRKLKRVGYSSAGDFNLRTYTHLDKSIIETTFVKNSSDVIQRKIELLNESNRKVREWKYESGVLQWVDRFDNPNEKQITSRTFIEDKKVYEFVYKENSRYGDEITSFTVRSDEGEVIGQYQFDFDGDVPSILKDQFRGAELERRLEQFENKSRIPVAVIDSGFDLFHPTITPYLVNNSAERWASVEDRDGNGLAGDVFGWSMNSLGQESGNINEPVIMGGLKPFPLSHGSHVASIAMKDRVQAALYGFAGDVAKPKYLAIVSKLIKEKEIKLANMSWGFKELGAPFTPPPASYRALKDLIIDNPHTLFHVAAGNNAWDLEGKLKDYPASYAYNNLLVIGSLHEDDYHWKDGKGLVPARYKNNLGSNIGKISVDAFAPGKDVNGAALGGGMIRKSGTSMASPFAMNSSIAVLVELPDLSALKLKELMMKSVGHPKVLLPCVSGGFIHPKRSLRTAKLLKESPHLSIEEAILMARLSEEDLYPGEVLIDDQKLKSIWKSIDQSLKINQE